MKTCSTPGKQMLAEWLVLATFGLIAPARDRIRREIEAHFVDGVARRVADGLALEDAEIAAALELGDAHAAAKAFRKQHLTEAEASWLRDFEDGYRPRGDWRRKLLTFGVLKAVGLSAATVAYVLWVLPHLPAYSHDILFVYVMAGWLVMGLYFYSIWKCLHLVTHYPSCVDMQRRLLLWSLFQTGLNNNLALGGAPISLFVIVRHSNPLLTGTGVVMLAFLLPFLTRRYRLWWKLRHAQIAPDNAVAA